MTETHRVPVEQGYTDDRGTILPLTHGDANVQMIWSKPGALRANHYHKTDTHTCYLVSGEMMLKSKAEINKVDKKATGKCHEIIFSLSI